MFNIIIAVDKNYGIGLEGKLPWHISDELKLFKKLTMDCVLLVGRKTYETLPVLNGRIIKVLSCNNFDKILNEVKDEYPSKKIFIIGGGIIFKYVMTYFRDDIGLIYLSKINKEYVCDTFIDRSLFEKGTECVSTVEYKEFTQYILKIYKIKG